MAVELQARAGDIFAQLSPDMYRDAYKRGMSLSAWLETQDPSQGYNDGLDAFGRLLQVAGIRTQASPEHGVYADRFEKFDANEQTRSLAHEWMARQWRSAQVGARYNTRGLYLSNDDIPGTVANQIAYSSVPRHTQIAPAIPLAELLALTTPIDAASYEAFYLTTDTDSTRMKRVAEGADIPLAKLVGGDHTIRLKKYGRGLEQSYEVIRRTRIDKVALWISILAAQTESDKVAAVIDVLVNGDGNTGSTPTNYNLTALDTSTTATNLTLKAWLAYKLKFANPYMLTHVLVQEAVALKLLLLNTGTANMPLAILQGPAGFGGFRNINRGLSDAVGMGWTSDAPSLKIVGFDSRLAVERVFEIGANIQEVEQYVRRQTMAIFMTEVEGYAILQPGAVLTLDVNA